MTCYKPLSGFKGEDGKLVRKDPGNGRLLEVPCGYCIGCRIDRSRDWAVRCTHEAQMHESNCFVTLTYDDDHLPTNGALEPRHFTNFIKQIRRHHRKDTRYFHCGEYGEENLRPHYHAILFGWSPQDQRPLFRNERDDLVNQSDAIDTAWHRGIASVGHVTFQSARYVASYIMKKSNGQQAWDRYPIHIDTKTGVGKPATEYCTMSRRPGIGYSWFQRYKTDLYPHDYCVVDGKKLPVPRYYDLLLEREDPELLEEIQERRQHYAAGHYDDFTNDRLAVREEVTQRKLTDMTSRNL